MLMKPTIFLMGIGLEGPDWDRDFFPDDLPADWRLSFYANEYGGILLPAEVWEQEQKPDDWLDDVPEVFDFHFQVRAGMRRASLDRLIKAADALDVRLKGLILEAEDEQGYDRLLDSLKGILPGRKLSVMSPCRDLSLCWQPELTTVTACGPGVLMLNGDKTPRELRTMIEDFAAVTTEETAILFVRAPVPAMENLKTLLDLMGY